ncbi:MAG: phosphate--acyl-ACP acyltransferase, partial [Syntrophomonadaceae bacterium]|nr:phosphate--acyl-ACP acyltransferase [Syntrophomonadaceae bacterium]
VHALLKEDERINFAGNIEGRELFAGQADVIVCDGFIGNVLLKTMEGMAAYMTALCSEELEKPPRSFERLDYSKTGGAPLLGINGISIVCHGSSKQEAVFNGIRIARDCCLSNLVARQQAVLNTAAMDKAE